LNINCSFSYCLQTTPGFSFEDVFAVNKETDVSTQILTLSKVALAAKNGEPNMKALIM
jgi:hypothetical protein